jgi:DtxR family Mn-dependent transcriptional regulator
MASRSLFEISPRRGEYLKYILEEGGTVTTNQLAHHFTVDPSTITKAISALVSNGLVRHAPYREITLTRAGKECAEFLVRRHRILGLLLAHHGLSSIEACQQAIQMEGMVPSATVDKLCASLGHPTQGICGEIPPGATCCRRMRKSGER